MTIVTETSPRLTHKPQLGFYENMTMTFIDYFGICHGMTYMSSELTTQNVLNYDIKKDLNEIKI